MRLAYKVGLLIVLGFVPFINLDEPSPIPARTTDHLSECNYHGGASFQGNIATIGGSSARNFLTPNIKTTNH